MKRTLFLAALLLLTAVAHAQTTFTNVLMGTWQRTPRDRSGAAPDAGFVILALNYTESGGRFAMQTLDFNEAPDDDGQGTFTFAKVTDSRAVMDFTFDGGGSFRVTLNRRTLNFRGTLRYSDGYRYVMRGFRAPRSAF